MPNVGRIRIEISNESPVTFLFRGCRGIAVLAIPVTSWLWQGRPHRSKHAADHLGHTWANCLWHCARRSAVECECQRGWFLCLLTGPRHNVASGIAGLVCDLYAHRHCELHPG